MKKTLLLIGGIAMVFILFWMSKKEELSYVHITGQTMGTITYNVKFAGEEKQLDDTIALVLKAFNQSLSTYIPDSEISQLNRAGALTYESDYFYPILAESKKVFEITGGSYDPTVGPLIQAWGFGPNKEIPTLDSADIDSLKALVGFEQVQFDEKEVSQPVNYQLDFSAIAKGYAVDVVADLLEEHNISDYLVEIGGEVRCKGVNKEGETWSVGIEDPLVELNQQDILAVVRLKDRSLATSGNYRNYYERDGQIYAHIVDPRTGYNATHNLLSASVFASDCMSADAYATAFMVLGLENTLSIVENTTDLDAILIYRDERGELSSHVTNGIQPFVELNRTN